MEFYKKRGNRFRVSQNFLKRKHFRNDSPVKIVNEPIHDGPDIVSASTEASKFENSPEYETQHKKSVNDEMDADADDEETVALTSSLFIDSPSDDDTKNKNLESSKAANKAILKKRIKKDKAIKGRKKILPRENTDDGLLIEHDFSKHVKPFQFGSSNRAPGHRRERKNLNKGSVAVLKNWIYKHRYYAYPTEDDKMQLAEETGLSLLQISNWFINARRRVLPEYLMKEGLILGKDKAAFIIKKRPRAENTENKDVIKKEKSYKNDEEDINKDVDVEPIRKKASVKPTKKKKDVEPIRKKFDKQEIQPKVGTDEIRKKVEPELIGKKIQVEQLKQKAVVEPVRKRDDIDSTKLNKLDKIKETATKLKEEPLKVSSPEVELENTKREIIFSSTQDGVRHVIGHKIINLGTGKVIKLEIYSKQGSKSKTDIEKKGVQKNSAELELKKKNSIQTENKFGFKKSLEEKDPLQIEPEDVKIFSTLNASEPESIDRSDKEVIVLENKSGSEGSYSLVPKKINSNENLKSRSSYESNNNSPSRIKEFDDKTTDVSETSQLFKNSSSGYNYKINKIQNSRLSESRSHPSSIVSKINSNKIKIKPVAAYKSSFKYQTKEIKLNTSIKLNPTSQEKEIEEITPPKVKSKKIELKDIKPSNSLKSDVKSKEKEFQPIITFKNVLKDQQIKDTSSIRNVKPTLKSSDKQVQKKIILSSGGSKKEIILKEKVKSIDSDRKIDPPNMNFENVETFSNDVSNSFANTNCRDIIIKGICKQAKRAKCLYMLVDDNESDSDVEYSDIDDDYCDEMQEEILEDDDFEF
ncbi:uncharacterized protein LOC129614615 isoform X2 [Condylostylus longicornis]|uniref:uncharacterized protein LOC129614615 isoform X2 n=1 Tax=Condylostylus longicornis TaxID=2530218 RepID=UPI00244DFA96|nr:uncharacterized protein LOC129614615 isoform X2 [Condylostylus longicornis]